MITKKEITITGYAVNPIKVGEPALIAESNGDTRRTSKVVNVSKNTDTEVRFA